MTKSRKWTKLAHPSAQLYYQYTWRESADGMPRIESQLLAYVNTQAYRCRPFIKRTGTDDLELPSHYAEEAAMQSVLDYLQQHEDPELL